MDGHAAAVGGAIVDSGNFDWDAHADKYPGLTTPDDSYHGITYTEKFGQGGAYITKATAQLMRDFGSTPAPMNALLLNLGIGDPARADGPALRERAGRGRVPRSQRAQGGVGAATPACPATNTMSWRKKYMPNGTCGVVSFGVKGGRAGGRDRSWPG